MEPDSLRKTLSKIEEVRRADARFEMASKRLQRARHELSSAQRREGYRGREIATRGILEEMEAT